MDIAAESLRLHEQWQGKLNTVPKMDIKTREDLALAYTPGVAEPCRKIAAHPADAYKYTMKANAVAVVSDGSAVLGLGNIGPLAAMPVMEGKCALFKAFGGVNAVPLCLDTQDVDEIVETVKRLAPSFGGINLEDISAPRCFEIERRLIDELDIPVFHDDQHGTAVCCGAALINACRLTGRRGGVTQSPQDQFVADTVLDEVTVSLRHSAGAGDPAAGAEEVLRRIQLWRFRRLSPYMLSQGQQRRLGVAALLAYDCQVLVCDEPTYAQDRGRTAAIMDALQREVVERGLTLILSTHDRALAQDYADILYELKEGSLYEVAQSHL